MNKYLFFIAIWLFYFNLFPQEGCYKEALTITSREGKEKVYDDNYKTYWKHVYCLERHAVTYKKENYYISFMRAAVSIGGCAECSEYFRGTVPKLIDTDTELFLGTFEKLEETEKKWILDFYLNRMIETHYKEVLAKKMNVYISNDRYKIIVTRILSSMGVSSAPCKEKKEASPSS